MIDGGMCIYVPMHCKAEQMWRWWSCSLSLRISRIPYTHKWISISRLLRLFMAAGPSH